MADKQQVRADIREFLTTRRARVTPERAGLRVFGSSRRVAGLRREEVATLAGISAEYYTRLERGNVTGASESVLDGISHALQLTDDERAHLNDLVQAAGGGRPAARRRRPQARVRATVLRIMDSMMLTPAFVVDSRLDVLAANELGRALYAPVFADAVKPPNHARFLFLDRHAPAPSASTTLSSATSNCRSSPCRCRPTRASTWWCTAPSPIPPRMRRCRSWPVGAPSPAKGTRRNSRLPTPEQPARR